MKSRCILFRVQKGLEVMKLIVIELELSNIIVKGHHDKRPYQKKRVIRKTMSEATVSRKQRNKNF